MSERAAYSRVYWSVVDDPKFVTIYDDDHHFAAWTRLLLIADQSHPASAHLPTNVRRASVKALSEAGLIDLQPGSRYRVHGLDAERARRRDAATSRPPSGPKSDPNGPPKVPERSPTGIQTPGLRRDETSLDETRQDEPTGARDGLPNLDRVALDALEERTGHVASQAGEKQLGEFDRLVGDHGLEAVCAAFDAVSDGKRMSARQLVWGAVKVLEPFVDPKELARLEREAETQRQADNGFERTQRYLAELRSVGNREGGAA